jgi:hypothetical protein
MNGESYRLKQSKARRRKEPQTVAEPKITDARTDR